MRTGFAGLVAAVQIVLFLASWFVYETWTAFQAGPDPPGITWLEIALAALSVSFVAASLLAFRYSNLLVRLLYRIASVWVGILNFLLWAAGVCWVLYVIGWLAGVDLRRPGIAALVFGVAAAIAFYGMINARCLRVRRVKVNLENLPDSWRGRVAALISDVHLGPVNGRRFMQRIVRKLAALAPDVVLITGDLYDGTVIDAAAAAAPWKDFSPVLGAYFVTGNHEEFSDSGKYLEAVSDSGIKVLNNEKVTVDGLDIVGVPYWASTRPDHFRSVLQRCGLERKRATVLLSHSPHALNVAESAGVSIQLSGHTHGGQFFPFTWLTRRIFGAYTHGLHSFGRMMVYTSSGAGTWGPPLRVGARPEIVLITFSDSGAAFDSP
jgi:predicted MPP superfamily phosphohydrolase